METKREMLQRRSKGQAARALRGWPGEPLKSFQQAVPMPSREDHLGFYREMASKARGALICPKENKIKF